MNTPPPANRADGVLEAVLDLAPTAREEYMVRTCGSDPALLAEVRALLAAHEAMPTGFLTQPAVEGIAAGEFDETIQALPVATPPLHAAERAGEMIGPYKLREQIGEGGFGSVWVADQEQPVRRRVALKIIKLGMDTKEVIARFEQERQALAMMDHPNIARVLDAGAIGHGRPFFVMELARGVKITDYCDDQQLSTQERIELFITVCQAVQHAHQKGIIHRDLKPSNILVTINDGKAVPKVIDFGVAKATQGRLTDQTVYTQFQQMIGTPLYMSPEQAGQTSQDIDTRSDIYALGVLLYELLTGHTPIEEDTLARLGMDEIRRIIREVDPPRPSTRMQTLATAEMTTAAKHRHTEPAKLSVTLRGDLDWIVMKCLEKDRARRYETANGLAMDLQRHLKNEVVIARPPTKAYLLGKWIKRNKSPFIAGCGVVMALIVGFAVAVWQARRAQMEAARAKVAEQHSAAALEELRATAPAFAEQARALAAREQFAEAIDKLDYALKLRPAAGEYLVAKGDLLQCQLKLTEAAAVYREALRLMPGLARAETSVKLCDDLLAVPANTEGKLTRESLATLHVAMQKQQRPAAELMPVARLLGEEKKFIVEYWLARLKDLPISAERPLKERLTVLEDGLLGLDLSETKITDLAPFAGMPLGSLNLANCKQITDFATLHELRSLTSLDLQGTEITDLSPLNGLPLEDLGLTGAQIFDIGALRGMRLKKLSLRDTRVADLTPLTGMPLDDFDATAIPATDYSPLAGATLEICMIQESPLRDLSFLQDAQVKQLTLSGCHEARNFAVLARIKSLNLLVLPTSYRKLPTDELAAIEALRTHPTLRSIDTSERRTGPWAINSAQSKEEFWKAWDREQALAASLRAGGFSFNLSLLPDGKYRLAVENQPLSDLAFLKDVPIGELIIAGTSVSDLRPLEPFALTRLDIRRTPIKDLGPLRSSVLGESLRQLDLWRIPATDFSPIASCRNLEWLDAADTELADLEIVRGCKLRVAMLSGSKITDLSPLAGMPLERVTLRVAPVTDLSPLLKCPTLAELVLPLAARDVNVLRALPRLTKLSYDEVGAGFSKQTAEDFWPGYEHGGITTEVVSLLSERSIQSPQDSILAMKVAALQAWFGQESAYAATCERVITAAERDYKSETKERAARNWCLQASADVAMLQRVLALAREVARMEVDAERYPWSHQTLGMAEFRAGNDEAAEAAFLRAETASETGGWHPELRPFVQGPSRFFRAMILFKQGKTDDAQRHFQQAEVLMPPMPEGDGKVLPVNTDQDELLFWLTCKEAKAVLARPGPPGSE